MLNLLVALDDAFANSAGCLGADWKYMDICRRVLAGLGAWKGQ